jgi:bifunctional non-homologous end joining protein LigD
MRLAVRREAFSHPDWIFEVKYDGFRSLARVAVGQVELISRRRNVYKSFAALCADLNHALVGRTAVLDGEIVCLDPEGHPQFYDLLRHRGEVFFYAFDLLWLEGRDLRPLPLVDRKAELERLVPADSRLLYVRHLEADGTGLFAAVCQNDLEGIVGKWKRGPYLDGRNRKTTWVKVLNPNYSQRAGRSELFNKTRMTTAGGEFESTARGSA